MTAQAENKVVVRTVLEAIDAGDLGALDAHPGYWQTQEVMPMLKAAFPDLRHAIQMQVAENDLVATFSIVTGTHQSDFLGVPATGRSVRFQHLDMDRVVDGKVMTHNAESGWLSVFLDWGILPIQKSG